MPSRTGAHDEPSDGTRPAIAAEPYAAEGGGAGLRLYTPAEAAELLTVRESWLRRQAGQRRIPCTFLGRHLRFSHQDLDKIIAAGARSAKPARRSPHSRRP